MSSSRRFISISITNLACLLLLVAVEQAQQTPRGITPEDYFAFEFISDPNISPDGKLAAYVVTKIDRAQVISCLPSTQGLQVIVEDYSDEQLKED